jgi:RimJ/RimL family protein N-acetyltransferase
MLVFGGKRVVMENQIGATDNFNHAAMQDFMRIPELYWSAADALSPQPEQIDFVGHMAHPDTWTVAITYDQYIVGYVQFIRRTSIGAEIHVGFHPNFRGHIAKGAIQYAIGVAFGVKHLLKLWAIIPSDNRPAIALSRSIGFVPEGRLRQAIMRGDSRWGKAGLKDLVLLGLSRDQVKGA